MSDHAAPHEPPRRPLPDATRLGPVVLQVADLGRSLDWYERVLGLRHREASADRAVLGAGGGGAPLVELREDPRATPVPRRGRLGLYHFALLLPDRPALGRFLVHLAAQDERAGASDHAVSEALYLQDPDGLGVEVYADRPREAWGRDGDELAMDTRPLDGASLARAAGGVGWAGLPAGSVVGHVHLHVGDLPRATRFYRDGLGLRPTVWSYPGALFLAAGGYHHHLGVNTWAAGAEPPGPDDARLLEWTVVLPSAADVEAAAAGLEEAGFRAAASGPDRLASDPWGTTLRLTAAHA